MFSYTVLLSNAKSAEDQVQDVIRSGGAGDFVERVEGIVKIHEEHLVRYLVADRGSSRIEGGGRPSYQLLVAQVGEEAGLGLSPRLAADMAENLCPEFWNALASDR
jgi:hypothetical protein